MAKNDRVTCWTVTGIVFLSLSLVLVIFASAFPYWMETRKALNIGVPNIGLWEICFDEDGFAAPAHANDVFGKRYHGCNYVFDRDLEGIVDWIFPKWYAAVAAMVTFGFLLLPIALIVSVIYMCRVCSPHFEHILLISSSCLGLVNGLMTASGIFVFGLYADSDSDWVAAPETNFLSYSFGACAFVPIFCFLGSMCHFVDYLRVRAQKILNARAKVYSKGEFNNRF